MVKMPDLINLKFIAGILFLIYALTTLLRRQLRIIWLALRLPGPFAYPIIGNALWAVDHKRLAKTAFTCREDFGPIFRAWVTVFPLILLVEPAHIQKVLGSSKHVEKIYFYKMMHNFLGEGLITSDGAKWRSHRKLIQPSFHLSVLEEFVQIFSKGSQQLVTAIEEQIQKRSSKLDVTPLVNQCVVNLLSEVILGMPVDPKTAFAGKHSTPFRQGSLAVQYRWIRPWLLFNSIYKLTELARKEVDQKNALINFTRQVIKDRRSELTKNKCFLDYLLKIADNNQGFTEEDCIQEACTLMLAGQDSVGAAIAFCLHLLATHPEAQNKVIEELDSVFGTSPRPVTSYDLRELKYLEQCIKETMRLYPSVPFIARTLGEDVQLGEYTLPEGCEILITPFATHRLSDHYPEPEKFNPDRFDPERIQERHPYAYLPFSAGPRNCIGYKFAILEMKTVVASILRKYRLSPVPGKETLDLRYRITLRASGGIWAEFTPRKEISKHFDAREL